MIVEDKKDDYSSDGTASRRRFYNEEDLCIEICVVRSSLGNTLIYQTYVTISGDIKKNI